MAGDLRLLTNISDSLWTYFLIRQVPWQGGKGGYPLPDRQQSRLFKGISTLFS